MDLYGENMDNLNPIISKGNIDIFESDIQLLTSEYIEMLEDSNLIYKSSCFQGLLEFIYRRLLKNIIKKDNNYNYDYDILNDIHINIFMPLCSIYNITPTLIMFCVNLCHIDYRMIRDIKNGILRNGNKVNDKVVNIVNDWSNKSESSLISKTIEHNSIGSIFTLKSVFKYSDNQPIQIEYKNTESHKSIEEIKEKYSNAFLPSDNEIECLQNETIDTEI